MPYSRTVSLPVDGQMTHKTLTSLCVCMHVCIYTYICMCTHACIFIYIHVCASVYMSICVCIAVYVTIRMCSPVCEHVETRGQYRVLSSIPLHLIFLKQSFTGPGAHQLG